MQRIKPMQVSLAVAPLFSCLTHSPLPTNEQIKTTSEVEWWFVVDPTKGLEEVRRATEPRPCSPVAVPARSRSRAEAP